MAATIWDTGAWHVTAQLLEHLWGGEELSSDEFLSVCKSFWSIGGSWKDLMAGDIDQITKLNTCIKSILGKRRLSTTSK
jgi:hypothetical protein